MPALAQPGGALTFDVARVDVTVGGSVCVALFGGAEGFPSEGSRALRSLCQAASNTDVQGVVRFTFDGLAQGRYAASVFHDVNSDGKLNTGLFGIPREPFGFTRNPTIRIGAPKFEDCAVSLGGQDVESRVGLLSL
jgi:uncharacterized protein (DUF2141 family)